MAKGACLCIVGAIICMIASIHGRCTPLQHVAAHTSRDVLRLAYIVHTTTWWRREDTMPRFCCVFGGRCKYHAIQAVLECLLGTPIPAAPGAAAQMTLANSVSATGADVRPRKGLFGLGRIQVQPQAYIALVGQPLSGATGDRVQLPILPQMGGVNLAWDLKLAGKSLMSGAGTLIPLTTIQPGQYTIDVTATDGNSSASASCPLMVTDPKAPTATAPTAGSAADSVKDSAGGAAANAAGSDGAGNKAAAGTTTTVPATTSSTAKKAVKQQVLRTEEGGEYEVMSSQLPVLLTR